MLLGRFNKLKESLKSGNPGENIKQTNEAEFDLDTHLEENYDEYYHDYEDPMDKGNDKNSSKMGWMASYNLI